MHELTNNMSEAIQDLSVNSTVLLVCSNLSFPAGIDDVTHHMFQFTDHVPVNVHTLTIWDELTKYSFICLFTHDDLVCLFGNRIIFL